MAGGADRLVEFADFPQQGFAASELRGAAGQSGIDHEEIAFAVELEEFDGAADEVGQARLAGVARLVLGEGEILVGENAEDLRVAPTGGVVEFLAGADDVESALAHFEEQIASVAPRSALRLGHQLGRAAAEYDIGVCLVDELQGEGVAVVGVGCFGIKRGEGGIGQGRVRNQSGGASAAFGRFEDGGEG